MWTVSRREEPPLRGMFHSRRRPAARWATPLKEVISSRSLTSRLLDHHFELNYTLTQGETDACLARR